jgi:methylase of polypeptide subunit release factors
MVAKINDISKMMMQEMIRRAEEGTYRVDVCGIPIDVFPYVFPPVSPFSDSSISLSSVFGDVRGKLVLDIGTGTGIQAIRAVLAGACSADAVDINPVAVDCAAHNVMMNGLDDRISVYESDLFSAVPDTSRYDLIIANLPIIDYPADDIRFHALFDPGFRYHERLFAESPTHLEGHGKIVLCHADIHEDSTFKRLESLANDYGFLYSTPRSIHDLGYEWRVYEFGLSL